MNNLILNLVCWEEQILFFLQLSYNPLYPGCLKSDKMVSHKICHEKIHSVWWKSIKYAKCPTKLDQK